MQIGLSNQEGSNMSEAVSVYYSSDGEEWAAYLRDKLISDSDEITIETILKEFETTNTDTDTKVNVFLITPNVVTLDNWNLMNYFDSSTSLAVLTGVTSDEWSSAIQEFRTDSLHDWCFHEIIADEDSVRQLLVLIVSLYENKLYGPEDEIYANIPAGEKSENIDIVPLPEKRNTSSVSISEQTWDLSSVNYEDTVDAEAIADVRTDGVDGKSKTDSIYLSPPTARPVNTVSYVFRQAGKVYLLLEGVNNGLVQVKFHVDDTLVTAACVSEKTTVYSFQHKGTDQKTFDVTLDGIEIGYGTIEREHARTQSGISDDAYSFPDPVRGSAISVSSESSSMSSRSSNASSHMPSPCSNKPARSKRTSCTRSQSESSETSEVKFSLASPMSTDSVYESPKSWTGSDRDTLTETASRLPPVAAESAPKPVSRLDQIHKLLEEVTDPVTLLCQSLQVDNLHQLDDKMTALLQATETLKQLSFKTAVDALPDRCDAVCPTLMHFGAKFNLRKFCKFLLDSPITQNSAVKRNKYGCYPHDVARHEGHEELATLLEDVSKRRLLSKAGCHDSGISQCTSPMPHKPHGFQDPYVDMSGMSPPPVKPCIGTTKSGAYATQKTGQKSILKRTSQESLRSPDEDYEVPVSHSKEGSVSSSGSVNQEVRDFQVTEVQCVYIADEDGGKDNTQLQISSIEPYFDEINDSDASVEDEHSNQEVTDNENTGHTTVGRSRSGETRTHRKDIESYFGIHTSASAPSEVNLAHGKKQGMLGKIFGAKKDKARTISNPRITAAEMEKLKAQVFRKDLIESDPSSGQFRSRLSTYPGPAQTLSRPNLKHLKKHLKSEKDFSSVTDLTGRGEGGINIPATNLPMPCSSPLGPDHSTNSPFERSRQHYYVKRTQRSELGACYTSSNVVPHSSKKEVIKRGKKKSDKTDNNKKIQLVISNAQKRTSMRLHHARHDSVTPAPALPPRPKTKLKPLGAF